MCPGDHGETTEKTRLCWLLLLSSEKRQVYLFNYLVISPLRVTGSQEREKILVLEARNSCAIKHPSAWLVPWRAEKEKRSHGDQHGETLCIGLWQVHFIWKSLCASAIVMMEPLQDREGEDLP